MKPTHPINPILPCAGISERIVKRYSRLSAGHQAIADFVLAHPFRAATMSIDELAQAAGVSVATANRFTRALDFDGYPKFRDALFQAFESTLRPVASLQAELQRDASSFDVMAASLREDIENLQASLRQLDAAACRQAVDLILDAPRIFVLGFSTSAYLGAVLTHRLESCCPVVLPIASEGGPSQAARRLFKLRPNDLVIAISFPRYNKITVDMLGLARKRNAKILGFTDRASGPIVPLCDLVLFARSNHSMSANSEAAALALIEAVCAAVQHRTANAVQNAAELSEFLVPYLCTDADRTGPMAQPQRAVVPAPLRRR